MVLSPQVTRVCTLALACALSAACTARPALRDDPSLAVRGHQLALAAADAHGGLARWRTVGGVELHLRASGPYYPREGDYLFDPARNRAVARFHDKHGAAVEWRYDGKRAVILRDGRCVGSAKERARTGGLLSNLLFWFGVPFKFLDRGATVRLVDDHTFFVTYKDVGDTPDDWYLVTLAPDHHVDHLIYVASGFSRLFEFVATFEDWRPVDGLLVAMRRRVAPKNGWWRLLAPRIAYDVTSIALGQPLDDAAFAPPAGCA